MALAEVERLRHQAEREEQKTMAALAAAALGAGATAVAAGLVFLSRRNHQAALARISGQVAEAKRLAAGEVEHAKRWGAEPLAKSLIPVADNLEALVASASAAGEGEDAHAALVEGARLTSSSLVAALAAHSVERVAPERGAPFDPHVHDGAYTVPLEAAAAEGEKVAAGSVAELVRPGWLLHEQRVLRAAQVGVFARAEAPAAAVAPEPADN